MSTYCTSIYFILICLMLSLQHTSEAVYSFQCPTQSHWRHREAYCNSSVSYFCLYDRNNENFTEICRKTTDRDFEKAGYKLVVAGSKQGTLDGDLCEKNFYQPFPFNSSGNSRCVYQKSHCSEAGQVIYSNGTTKANIECRCDHMQGYDFLHRPKNLCFCVPSDEDCTCYLKICSSDDILSPDYECLRKNEWKVKFNCEPKNIIYGTEEISTSISTESHINQSDSIAWNDLIILIVTLCMIVYIAAICVYILGMKTMCNRRNCLYENETTHRILQDATSTVQDHSEVIRWRKSNLQFEETTASKTVLDKMKTHGFVILSGPPGSGKSAIAYNAAFMLEKDAEFIILPVTSPEDIRKYILPETKQIFVIDDPVGRYAVDDTSIRRWKNEENFIKETFNNSSNKKLILTCRSYIYKSGFSRLLHVPSIHSDLLSSDLKLSLGERTKVCKRYNLPELNEDTIIMYDFFPLLCVLYSPLEDTSMFFVNPYKILIEEIGNIKKNSDIAFLAIALLVIQDDNIAKQSLSLENQTIKELLNDLCNECGFKYFPSTTVLLSALYDLIGTYVKETEHGFACIHATLFRNLSYIVGSSIIHCLLKYGKSEFLANRLQLASIQQDNDKLVIMVIQEKEELYFQRLLLDIKKGNQSVVFTGIQMKYSRFRSKLLTYLKHLKAGDLRCDQNDSTPLHVVSEQGYDDLVFTLYQTKTDHINHQDNEKRTPLYMACLGGHDKVALTLLAYDKSLINIANNDDLTPFDAALDKGHLDTVNLLLQHGANIDRQDKKIKRTALHRACENGRSDVVNVLLNKRADVKNVDIYGLKAIHIACQRGNLEIVELLLNYKDWINESDAKGRTPLVIACENNHQNIVDILLKRKANVNQRTKTNISPLYTACQIGNEYIVAQLLDASANVNVQTENGSTSLYMACCKGDMRIVEILLNKKADVNIANKQGCTPFLISCSKGHLQICKVLQQSGANINTADKLEFTPLHVACRDKLERIARFLLEHNANVNAVNKIKESPLYISCTNDSSNIVELLLNKNADVKLCEERGNSPLHAACLKGNKQIVQLLLDKKADKYKRNKEGKTPFVVVQEKDRDKIATLLNRENDI